MFQLSEFPPLFKLVFHWDGREWYVNGRSKTDFWWVVRLGRNWKVANVQDAIKATRAYDMGEMVPYGLKEKGDGD